MTRFISFCQRVFDLLLRFLQHARNAHSPYHRTKALLGLLTLSLVCCQKQFDETEDIPQVPAPPSIILTAQIRAGTAPNQYAVTLFWKSEVSYSAWRVYRHEGNTVLEIAQIERGKLSFDDTSAQPTKKYSYEVTGLGVSPVGTSNLVEVLIPFDIKIEGKVNFDSISQTKELNVRRLYFAAHSILYTHGADVRITAEEIYSDQGELTTFDWTRAEENQAGKSGGSIEVVAKKGSGLLRVIARGQSGGNGSNGQKGEPGAPGAPGLRGLCGFRGSTVNCETVTRQQLESWRKDPAFSDVFSRFHCLGKPHDGAAGGKGGRGENGRDGAHGGDSGTVLVKIVSPEGFIVEAGVSPGEGGKAGAWGDGGDGGAGGPPGAPDHLGLCPHAEAGASGERGEIGKYGKDGEPGRTQSYCIVLADRTEGRCTVKP